MIKFKEYSQDQGLALPPYLDEMIDSNHIVRVLSKLVDSLDIEAISSIFKSNKHNQGGNKPYHPGMMLKILIYSYMNGVYTCRSIAKQLRENIHYMWLSGMQRPDFRTINRYRSEYFKDILPQVFTELLHFLKENGMIDLKDVFADGTKISADSNKHKVVWSKQVENYKARLRERVYTLFSEIESLDEEEMKRYGELDLPERGESSELGSADLQEVSENISEILKVDGKISKTDAGKKLRKTARQLKDDAKKLEKYHQQEKDLSGRKSASRTDIDASVMKLKNDELRPGYNVQMMTNNDFIVGTSVSQNANDGIAFSSLLENYKKSNLKLPDNIVADAGYGHEAVYSILEDNGVTAYVKYPSYFAEKSKESKYRYHYTKFTYNKEKDVFICPQNKELHFYEPREYETSTGYVVHTRVYQCYECNECPSKDKCTESEFGRRLTVSFKLMRYKQEIRDRLSSESGSSLYNQRGFRTETVFGEWKHNLKFTRFHLRGFDKVKIEILFLSIAYNIRKLASKGGKLTRFIINYFFSIYTRYIRANLVKFLNNLMKMKIIHYPNEILC